MRKLCFRQHQSPGDSVVFSATIRDIHANYPGEFETAVCGNHLTLFEHNPHVAELTPEHEHQMVHYPAINESSTRSIHFIDAYNEYVSTIIGKRIKCTSIRGDIYLSEEEKEQSKTEFEEFGVPERFWIINAGFKHDFTAKASNPFELQKVIDHYRGRITFVQVGERNQWHCHPRLSGVVDMIGRTSLRSLLRLVHRSSGIVCGTTMLMHLAAAVEPYWRPAVILAGGREAPHWNTYPGQQYLGAVGTLDCCRVKACWRSRCQLVGDNDVKDRHEICEQPIQIAENLRIPRCMDMITSRRIIDAMDLFLEGGMR